MVLFEFLLRGVIFKYLFSLTASYLIIMQIQMMQRAASGEQAEGLTVPSVERSWPLSTCDLPDW